MKPNILIVMADHFPGYVARKDHPAITPNLDRFGDEGVRFEQVYCPTPHCCPSRASFQTGEYPSRHGVWNNVSNRCAISRDIKPGIQTLGEHLTGAGYSLAYAGKWHVSDLRSPADFGWKEYPIAPSKRAWETRRIPEDLKEEPEGDIPPGTIRRPGWGNLRYYETTEANSEKHWRDYENLIPNGISALNELAKGNAPWCAMLSTNVPHDPHFCSQQYVDLYKDKDIDLPESWKDDLRDKPRVYQRMRNQYWSQMSKDEAIECLRHFYAKCTMVDDWFGQILAALQKAGQADNTLVIFTSDHGDYGGAHGLWAKGVPSFSEAYHIPGIVRWPRATANPGRNCDQLVSTCDFFSTIVEAATGKAPDVYGQSLLPFLRDENPAWRDDLFTQLNGVEQYYTQRITRTKDWKLVYNGFDFDELYDLKNDPREMKNLASPDLYPDQSPKETNGQWVPWPRMTPELEAVRKDLYGRMWKFAADQKDHFSFTGYITTSLAAYGPKIL